METLRATFLQPPMGQHVINVMHVEWETSVLVFGALGSIPSAT